MDKSEKIIEKEEFKDYITSNYSLTEDDFERLLEDFNYYYNLDIKSFIRTRHMLLKSDGYKNPEIYQMLSEEIKSRRFCGERISERQIRRIIYG